jgi:hypothetical protein
MLLTGYKRRNASQTVFNKGGFPDTEIARKTATRYTFRYSQFLREGPVAVSCCINGRGGGIRTPDPLVPNQMRYQTALRPDLI